jgi:CRISPR-associated protein Cas2
MLAVVFVESPPEHLRGYLDRFLFELRPGVYVGHTSERVATLLWQNIEAHIEGGDAFMASATRSEECGYRLRSLPHPRWRIVDYEGMVLPSRIVASSPESGVS